MDRNVPLVVLRLVDDWLKDTIRNRPQRGWTGGEIQNKLEQLKRRSGWGDWVASQKKPKRKADGEGRGDSDPTVEEIYRQAAELRALRKVEEEHWTPKKEAIRVYRPTRDGDFERIF